MGEDPGNGRLEGSRDCLMPVDETTQLTITCGWLFVTSEVYGEPTQQSVFCSVGCLHAATAGKPAMFTGANA